MNERWVVGNAVMSSVCLTWTVYWWPQHFVWFTLFAGLLGFFAFLVALAQWMKYGYR